MCGEAFGQLPDGGAIGQGQVDCFGASQSTERGIKRNLHEKEPPGASLRDLKGREFGGRDNAILPASSGVVLSQHLGQFRNVTL